MTENKGEKLKYSGLHKSQTRNVMGSNPGLHGEKSGNNNISYGTATYNETGKVCTYNVILQHVRATISFCKGNIIVIT